MLTNEQRMKADELLGKLVGFACEEYASEIKRLTQAIETHMESSLAMVKDDPRIRLSEADYKLWEVLNG